MTFTFQPSEFQLSELLSLKSFSRIFLLSKFEKKVCKQLNQNFGKIGRVVMQSLTECTTGNIKVLHSLCRFIQAGLSSNKF